MSYKYWIIKDTGTKAHKGGYYFTGWHPTDITKSWSYERKDAKQFKTVTEARNYLKKEFSGKISIYAGFGAAVRFVVMRVYKGKENARSKDIGKTRAPNSSDRITISGRSENSGLPSHPTNENAPHGASKAHRVGKSNQVEATAA